MIEKNRNEFEKNIKILKKNYPTKKIFSYEHIEVTKKRVSDLLNPVEGLNVYFNNFSEGVLKLSIQNIQRLPIKIIGLELDNGKNLSHEKKIIIDGKKPLASTTTQVLSIKCNYPSSCSRENISRQKIIYKIIGLNKESSSLINPFYFSKNY